MSNGFAEDASYVFNESKPYLVSVSSAWEKSLKTYEKEISELEEKIINLKQEIEQKKSKKENLKQKKKRKVKI